MAHVGNGAVAAEEAEEVSARRSRRLGLLRSLSGGLGPVSFLLLCLYYSFIVFIPLFMSLFLFIVFIPPSSLTSELILDLIVSTGISTISVYFIYHFRTIR